MIVRYEGRDISDDVELASCTYDCREFGRLPELRCEFRDADGKWGGWNPQVGDTIEIDDTGTAPTGEMTVSSVRPFSGSMLLVATAHKANPSSERKWKNASFRAICSQLAGDLGLSASFQGASGPTFQRLWQHGETALDMLGWLCAMSGSLMDAHDGRLVIYGRSWAESQGSVGTLEIEPADELGFSRREPVGSVSVVQHSNYDWKPDHWVEFETTDSEKAHYKADFEGTQSVDGGVTASGEWQGKAWGKEVKFRPKEEDDRREELSASASGTGSESRTYVLPPWAWMKTSAAMQTAANGLLAYHNLARATGHVRQENVTPLTPGVCVDVECDENAMVAGKAVVTRVRVDYVGNESKIWWRPL